MPLALGSVELIARQPTPVIVDEAPASPAAADGEQRALF
jgi:hypothetical protein